jgi:very-short-patch-repair endonuclease
VKPIEKVLRVSAEQHGAASVAQLRECGMSSKAQKAAIARNQLRLVERTVVVVFGSPDTWFRRLQIGLLALGPDAWVSHESAATLLGLDRTQFEPLHFTTRRANRTTLRRGQVHTTDVGGGLDVTTVHGFRCASATRTILDLAYLGVPPERLGPMIDSAVRLGWSAIRVLEERLGEIRVRGRRGVRVLDGLMPDSGGETPLERKFLGLLRRHGLPRPVTQFRAVGPKGLIARVDFIYEPLKIVIEVTGRKGHASDAERQRDAQRRNELTDREFLVYEYTRGDVDGRAGWVASTMRARLLKAGWVGPDRDVG